MKKLLPYILILVIITGIFSSINISFADIVCKPPEVIGSDGNSCITPYNFLVPLGDAPTFDPTGDGGGDLGKYLNVMIKLFIGVCAVLAVIMIVIGGLEYMTNELVSEKADGKNKIKGAVFGLVLALGAYTILYTINPQLLNTSFSSLEDVTVEVTLEDSIPQTPIDGKYKNGTSFGADWATVSGMAATQLPSWLGRNNGECQKVGDTGCTSTRGLLGNYVNTIHTGCPSCQLVLTGGSEFWLHGGKSGSTSHGTNSPTVDLRMDTNLTNYIKSGTKGNSPNRWTKDGISFLFEGDHWHVGP